MENTELSPLEYYRTVVQDHKRILKTARNLLEFMLNKASAEIIKEAEQKPEKQVNDADDQADKNKEKEDKLNTIARSVQLLFKLIPLEQKIAKLDADDIEEGISEIKEEDISMEDLRILEHYIQRRKADEEYQHQPPI